MRSRSFDKSDLRDNTLTVPDIAHDIRDAARRTVARHSPNAADLTELLTMLGLIGEAELRPLTPSGRAKAHQRAQKTAQAQEDRT